MIKPVTNNSAPNREMIGYKDFINKFNCSFLLAALNAFKALNARNDLITFNEGLLLKLSIILRTSTIKSSMFHLFLM
jgi:hypothetical protein